MPDFGRRNGGRPQDGDSLDAIAHSDQMLDALAGQYRVRPADAGEAELLSLLEGWRDGVRRPPAGHVISENEAAAAVHRGLSQRPSAPKGTRRHLAVVGSVAAAVLCIGGFGGVVASSGPGDSLYGMRTALFGEPESVRDDRVALAAQTEMAEVQRLIEQGDWDQAQQKLQTITTSVAEVDDATRQQELVDEWNLLNTRVETRDPAATLPPQQPGDPALTLPMPVTDTGTSSETSTDTTSPSSETSPTTEPSTTDPSTTQPSTTTEPGTTEPTATSEPSPTPTSTTAAAPPPSSSTSTSTTPSTTPSSTTPPTTTPPTSTSASSTRTTTTTTTTTTTVPQAEAPESTPAQSSTVVEADTETVPSPQAPPRPTVEDEVPVQPPLVTPTTTTVPLPVIQLPSIPGLN